MRIKECLILRKVGNQYMVLDPGTGVVDMTYVYALNTTAAWLWEQLKEIDFTLSTIANLLQSNYRLSADEAERDAGLFWSVLEQNELHEHVNDTQ